MSRAGWLVPFVAAVVVTGCASTSAPAAKTMSEGRFRYLGNRACEVDLRVSHRLPKPTNYATALPDIRTETRAFEAMIVAFRRLIPPPAEQPAFHRLIRLTDGVDVLVHEFPDAAGAGHLGSVKRIQRRLNREGKRFDRLAARLGLRVCAKS